MEATTAHDRIRAAAPGSSCRRLVGADGARLRSRAHHPGQPRPRHPRPAGDRRGDRCFRQGERARPPPRLAIPDLPLPRRARQPRLLLPPQPDRRLARRPRASERPHPCRHRHCPRVGHRCAARPCPGCTSQQSPRPPRHGGGVPPLFDAFLLARPAAHCRARHRRPSLPARGASGGERRRSACTTRGASFCP